MAAPSFVAEYPASPAGGTWSVNTTPQSYSVTVATGDVLVVCAGTADQTTTITTPSGGGLTYTLQQSVVIGSNCTCYVWTAVAASSQTFTLSIARSATANLWGSNVLRFSNTAGVGASNKTNSTGAPSLGLTTTGTNSAVVVMTLDWNAADGTSRTWVTSAGALTELTYFRDAANYTLYNGYHANVGVAGAKTVGLSAPGSQKYSIIAVEVTGTAGTTVTPPETQTTIVADNAAASVGPSGGSATQTFLADNAAPAVGVSATAATQTFLVDNAVPAVGAAPPEAAFTALANNAGVSGSPAGFSEAAWSLAGLDATVSTAAGTNAAATSADTTLVADNPAVSVQANAASAAITFQADNTTSLVSLVPAEAALLVTGTDATVALAGSTNVAAEGPGVVFSALDATCLVQSNAQTATLTATALDVASAIRIFTSEAQMTFEALNVITVQPSGDMTGGDRELTAMGSSTRDLPGMNLRARTTPSMGG